MMMRGQNLKRTKFFAFAHDDPNLFLKYSYTGFQWSSLKLYKRWSTVPVLKEALQGMCINDKPTVFNHIIGTLYSDQTDEIGAHHDKMLDIRAGSDIISLSLGDAREFVLTSEAGIEQQRVVLADGDLFVLGPRTCKACELQAYHKNMHIYLLNSVLNVHQYTYLALASNTYCPSSLTPYLASC